MQLGELMTRLDSEAGCHAALEALGDIVLLTEVRTVGESHDEAPGEYIANASRRFATQASDEDWLGLITAMEHSSDPARAALEKIVRWALKRDTTPAAATSHSQCSCGGQGGCDDRP